MTQHKPVAKPMTETMFANTIKPILQTNTINQQLQRGGAKLWPTVLYHPSNNLLCPTLCYKSFVQLKLKQPLVNELNLN